MSQAWRKERLLPSWGLGLGAEAPSPRQSSRTGSATSRMYPLRFLSSGHYSSPTPWQGAPGRAARSSDYACHAKGRTSSLSGSAEVPTWTRVSSGGSSTRLPSGETQASPQQGSGSALKTEPGGDCAQEPCLLLGKNLPTQRLSCDQRQCAHFLKCSPWTANCRSPGLRGEKYLRRGQFSGPCTQIMSLKPDTSRNHRKLDIPPRGASYTKNVRAKSLQSYLTLRGPMDCSPPGSSVHGILQARTLEWVIMPSSKGSCGPRDWISVS